MTPEDKSLLLKDLCMRLPYHPNIRVFNPDGFEGYQIGEFDTFLCAHHIEPFRMDRFETIKPYLRPMSSMTAEEKEEYTSYCFEQPFLQKGKTPNIGSVPMCIDWLLAHHFDFRGLIPRGLAIEAPKDMYNTKYL